MRSRIAPTLAEIKTAQNFIKIFNFLTYPTSFSRFILVLKALATVSLCLSLFACASSAVQRDAATNVDLGVQNAKNLVEDAAETDVVESYQNFPQKTKGAIIGGLAGAITGAFSSGIGVVPFTLSGAIFGASYGSYIDSTTDKRDRLENRGVSVVVLGDQILIVLRSARIFEPMTANIKIQAFTTLDLVTQYINRFTKILVKVAAYTNDNGTPEADLALSRQQAERIARYFIVSGIDARILYATGEGGCKLVDNISLDWDASDNYRIEITLEKLYV